MKEIISIDYGGKYSGLAIANNIDMVILGLSTINTKELLYTLKQYVYKYNIQIIVIGQPKLLNNKYENLEFDILLFIKKIKLYFNFLIVKRIDERFTTKIAKMIFLNIIKNKRKRIKQKKIIHQISAMIILESYLFSTNHDLTYNYI